MKSRGFLRSLFCALVIVEGLTGAGTGTGARVSASPSGTAGWAVSGDGLHHHPGIRISLWASEPMIVDPVAVCFDEHENAYVVEMRDYPYGFGEERRGGGTIRLLRDVDLDGRADTSTLFATGLSFPTTIMPWKEGVLVGAPPEVLYLADTDGDDVADHREVIISGFELGVTDSNMNSLTWGPDNRVHGANGGAGGTIQTTGTTRPPIDLSDADFAWDPASGALERTAQTGGGFGLVFNHRGDSFTTYNIDYLQQQFIPLRYHTGDSGIRQSQLTRNISVHGAMARIYPVSRQETRVNHPEQAGYFSSAGGMGILEAPYFGEELAPSIFVCDVVGNLVHRDLLQPDGPVWSASRAPEELEREFIASEDLWFRPVGLHYGPDGALYLVDMQRAVIEHPDYIPAKVLENMDYRAGEDRGRIYRITPQDPTALPDRFPFSMSPASHLAGGLESPNPWVRQTARRLMVTEIPPRSVPVGKLRKSALGGRTRESRIEALRTLMGTGNLEPDLLLQTMADPDPAVVITALRLSENLAASGGIFGAQSGLLQHRNQAVRFQAALSLSSSPMRPNLDPTLLFESWIRDHGNDDHRLALRILAGSDSPRLLDRILSRPDVRRVLSGSVDLIEQSARVASPGDATTLERLVSLAVESGDGGLQKDVFGALARGLSSNPATVDLRAAIAPGLAVAEFEPAPSAWFEYIGLCRMIDDDSQLQRQMEILGRRARRLAEEESTDPETRMMAIRSMGATGSSASAEALGALLPSLLSPELQETCLRALAELRDNRTGQWIAAAWPHIAPGLRTRTIQLILSRVPYRESLLDALENETISVSELNLDLEQRRTLLRWSPEPIRQRAAKWFGDEEYSNRSAVVDEWLARLPPSGDTLRGSQVFSERCAICHVVGDTGMAIGPELTGVFHRSDEDLLSHILDPNMAINPNYVTCTAETDDGDFLTGLLMNQTSTAIEIKLLTGESRLLQRDSLKAFRTEKRSLMPEGLEAGLTPHDLKSLVLFLQESR